VELLSANRNHFDFNLGEGVDELRCFDDGRCGLATREDPIPHRVDGRVVPNVGEISRRLDDVIQAA
jgi:hypothetical protein